MNAEHDIHPDPVELPERLPTADEMKASQRRTLLIVGAGTLVLCIIMGIIGAISVSGRTAARDSVNSTAVTLANQARGACITERRNAEGSAIGDETEALGRAQIAAFIHDDEAEALKQVDLFEAAVKRRIAASELLTPEKQDAPVEDGGCGPPILSLDDLEKVDGETLGLIVALAETG